MHSPHSSAHRPCRPSKLKLLYISHSAKLKLYTRHHPRGNTTACVAFTPSAAAKQDTLPTGKTIQCFTHSPHHISPRSVVTTRTWKYSTTGFTTSRHTRGVTSSSATASTATSAYTLNRTASINRNIPHVRYCIPVWTTVTKALRTWRTAAARRTTV